MSASTLTPARATVDTVPKVRPPVRGTSSTPAIIPPMPMSGAPGSNTLPARASLATAPTAGPPVREITSDRPAINASPAPNDVVSLADPMLALLANALDDLERTRIASENRLRQLLRSGDNGPKNADGSPKKDADGLDRGFGLTIEHPHVITTMRLVGALRCDTKILVELRGKPPRKAAGCCLEHDAERALRCALREHPLGAWIKSTPGVGEKQGARLLAAIGDPYWNTLHDRPRLVSELWSYCGYGDATTQVRRRGHKSNWSPTAKMRAHLVAVSCMKNLSGPYRLVYEAGREKYADSIHRADCVRCGPSGKPAVAGTPMSAGHQHACALRLVSKAILRDLWATARDIHTA